MSEAYRPSRYTRIRRSVALAGARVWSHVPSAAGPRAMIIGYHRVHADPGPLAVTPETFRRHLEVLAADSRIRVVALSEVAQWREPKELPVALTFDDAYADTLEVAAPILEAYGFPATVFAPTGILGSGPRMSVQQLAELNARSFDIGAHSRTHVDLRGCSGDQLVDEVRGSRADLEEWLGAPVAAFAYPYGALDARIQRAVRDAGFTIGVTTHRAWVRPGSDALALPRNFAGEYSAASFAAVVHGGMNYLARLDQPRPLARTG